jgi:hypothetical protein
VAALLLLARCASGDAPETSEAEVEPPVTSECQKPANGEQVLDFEPVADTYVESHQVVSYGDARKLVADSASERAAYLRFALAGLPGPVKRAELRLYAIDPSIDGPALYPAAAGWEEAAVSWQRAPEVTGAMLADVGAVEDQSWVAYDVTAHVRAAGAYGFGLFTTSRDGVDFISREHPSEALRPRLSVTVDVTGSGCGGGGGAP